MESGANANIRDNNGKTALMIIASNNSWKHFYIAKLLLEGGADVKLVDNYGNTTLDISRSAQNPNSNILKLQETVDIHNKRGWDNQ